MKKALEDLTKITTNYLQQNIIISREKKLMDNYNECISLCKQQSNYKLCLYDTNSTKYAIVAIKIEVPECSEIRDYTDIIRFNTYLENGEIKKLPYNYTGLIPNYKYTIGDNNMFEINNKNALRYAGYYLINLEIPFTIDKDEY